jgi:hypothetical protein
VGSLKIVKGVAQMLNVELHLSGVPDPIDLESTFATLARAKVEAFVMLPDDMFLTQ